MAFPSLQQLFSSTATGAGVGSAVPGYGTIAGAVAGAVSAFLGPDYNPGNGGEVQKQLEATGAWGQPWANSYALWLKAFYPGTWQNGRIWEDDGANASRFHDAYLALVAKGYHEGNGILLTKDLKPAQIQETTAQRQWIKGLLLAAGIVGVLVLALFIFKRIKH